MGSDAESNRRGNGGEGGAGEAGKRTERRGGGEREREGERGLWGLRAGVGQASEEGGEVPRRRRDNASDVASDERSSVQANER